MARHVKLALAFMILITPSVSAASVDTTQTRLDAVRMIIDAVNIKNPRLYASFFAEQAVVKLYDGAVRVRGRASLLENRSRHFTLYPQTRSEIQHLVEIGNVVIMHDRVWLTDDQKTPAEIVEIFHFNEADLIDRVDVIQPVDLFLHLDQSKKDQR